MNRVIGIDHISICVSNFKKSKIFYNKLFKFLGFTLLDEYEDAIGWTNGKTRYWISAATSKGKIKKYRIGDIGLHHYAFELRHRQDIDDLYQFLKRQDVVIVDPPDEYYENYYAVYFLDPDGIKLEAMKYGKKQKIKNQSSKRNEIREKRKEKREIINDK